MKKQRCRKTALYGYYTYFFFAYSVFVMAVYNVQLIMSTVTEMNYNVCFSIQMREHPWLTHGKHDTMTKENEVGK